MPFANWRLEHAEVLIQHGLELPLVTPLHCAELAAVHVERLAVVGDTAGVGVPNRGEPACDASHRRLDRLVATGADEGAVEHRVGPHHARSLAEMALEQVDGPAELDEVGRGRGAHRLVDDGPFEHASSAQDVDGRVLLELHGREDRDGRDEVGHDEDAAGLPAPYLDEPGELEDAKGLPEGRLRDPELRGECAFVRQAVTRAHTGPLDRLGEVLDCGLERPGGPDRLDREARRRHLREKFRRIAERCDAAGRTTGTRYRSLSRGIRTDFVPIAAQPTCACSRRRRVRGTAPPAGSRRAILTSRYLTLSSPAGPPRAAE